MPTVPIVDRSAVPPPPATACPDGVGDIAFKPLKAMPEAGAVAIVPGWERVALTPRGAAAARLSEFQDAWAELTPVDRQWFAEDLRDLLVEAVVPGVAPTY